MFKKATFGKIEEPSIEIVTDGEKFKATAFDGEYAEKCKTLGIPGDSILRASVIAGADSFRVVDLLTEMYLMGDESRHWLSPPLSELYAGLGIAITKNIPIETMRLFIRALGEDIRKNHAQKN